MRVEGTDAKIIFDLVTNGDYVRLEAYLKVCQKFPIDVISMKDHRKFTLLTYAAFKNNPKCF